MHRPLATSRRPTCGLPVLVFVYGCLTSAAVSRGVELVVETVPAKPPEELSEQVRGRLRDEVLRVMRDGEIWVELWLVNDPSMASSPEADLGVEFSDLEQAALLGAARFPSGWSDYKDTTIGTGTYTLRYAVQPANGDHMGVSEYRDFFLLLPAADDTDPEEMFEHDLLVDMSRGASQKVHPAVLAVFPIWDDVERPSVMANDIDQTMLVVELGGLTLGLVLEGRGEI